MARTWMWAAVVSRVRRPTDLASHLSASKLGQNIGRAAGLVLVGHEVVHCGTHDEGGGHADFRRC